MLRTAIVGVGWWGQTLVDSIHGKGDVQFVVGQTRTRGRAEEFCQKRNIKLVDDYAAVLADPSVEAVVLATPHSQHGEQVRLAAEAGKHIFCEKPFTLTSAEAERAIAAARKAGVVLAVGFNRRFHPSMRQVARRVRAGELGDVVSVLGQHTSFSSPALTADGWRTSPDEAPAGAMTAIGVHTLDCMIALFGPVSEVYCVTARRATQQADDTTSVLIKFANGVTGNIFCSISSAAHYSFKVFGLKGIAEIAKPNLDQFTFIPSPPRPRQPNGTPEVIETEKFDTLNAELAAFADAVAGKAPFPVPLDEVLMGVKAFEAVVRSSKEGRPVKVG
ncbi:MAG: Gfo/Idh/MocA family protein [Variibacter sp.]